MSDQDPWAWAVDMHGVPGSARRAGFLGIEFIVGVAVAVAGLVGAGFVTMSASVRIALWWFVGVSLVGVGINGLPLAVHDALVAATSPLSCTRRHFR